MENRESAPNFIRDLVEPLRGGRTAGYREQRAAEMRAETAKPERDPKPKTEAPSRAWS